MAFSNGKHQYKGKLNSASQRKMSKIYKGLKFQKKELGDAFRKLEEEKNYDRKR